MDSLILFIIASAILLITPGPSVFYIVTRSIDQGRKAGLISMLGVTTGGFVHVAAAALGISALLAASALAFNVVKYLGAAYLIWLGIQKLMEKDSDIAKPVKSRSNGGLFLEGVVVNALNPQTALFFLAFLPQFIDPGAGSVSMQILLLGTVFLMMGIISDGLYAILAGSLGMWLRKNFSNRMECIQRRFIGMFYILMGLAAALTNSNHNKH